MNERLIEVTGWIEDMLDDILKDRLYDNRKEGQSDDEALQDWKKRRQAELTKHKEVQAKHKKELKKIAGDVIIDVLQDDKNFKPQAQKFIENFKTNSQELLKVLPERI
jgi:hypothetical protein